MGLEIFICRDLLKKIFLFLFVANVEGLKCGSNHSINWKNVGSVQDGHVAKVQGGLVLCKFICICHFRKKYGQLRQVADFFTLALSTD
jgi:hypothetical protein